MSVCERFHSRSMHIPESDHDRGKTLAAFLTESWSRALFMSVKEVVTWTSYCVPVWVDLTHVPELLV